MGFREEILATKKPIQNTKSQLEIHVERQVAEIKDKIRNRVAGWHSSAPIQIDFLYGYELQWLEKKVVYEQKGLFNNSVIKKGEYEYRLTLEALQHYSLLKSLLSQDGIQVSGWKWLEYNDEVLGYHQPFAGNFIDVTGDSINEESINPQKPIVYHYYRDSSSYYSHDGAVLSKKGYKLCFHVTFSE